MDCLTKLTVDAFISRMTDALVMIYIIDAISIDTWTASTLINVWLQKTQEYF